MTDSGRGVPRVQWNTPRGTVANGPSAQQRTPTRACAQGSSHLAAGAGPHHCLYANPSPACFNLVNAHLPAVGGGARLAPAIRLPPPRQARAPVTGIALTRGAQLNDYA